MLRGSVVDTMCAQVDRLAAGPKRASTTTMRLVA